MEDIYYTTHINTYTVQLKLVDYGEQLHEYEGFWKWFLTISNNENEQLHQKEGSEHGYFGELNEALEDYLEYLASVSILDIEDDDLLEKIRMEVLNQSTCL